MVNDETEDPTEELVTLVYDKTRDANDVLRTVVYDTTRDTTEACLHPTIVEERVDKIRRSLDNSE